MTFLTGDGKCDVFPRLLQKLDEIKFQKLVI